MDEPRPCREEEAIRPLDAPAPNLWTFSSFVHHAVSNKAVFVCVCVCFVFFCLTVNHVLLFELVSFLLPTRLYDLYARCTKMADVSISIPLFFIACDMRDHSVDAVSPPTLAHVHTFEESNRSSHANNSLKNFHSLQFSMFEPFLACTHDSAAFEF